VRLNSKNPAVNREAEKDWPVSLTNLPDKNIWLANEMIRPGDR